MRKVLLTTTAIFGASTAIFGASVMMTTVAAAQEATPMELKISGYGKEEMFFSNQKRPTAAQGNGVHMESDDWEVHFNASAVADNGLKYGAKVEYDMDGNVADEVVISLSGAFGRIQLGDEDGAEDGLDYGGEDMNVGEGGWDGGPVWNTLSVRTTGMGMTGGTSDGTKITYYTPRFAGFMAGISYTPDTGASLGSSPANQTAIANAAGANDRNSWGGGVNYVETFGDIGVRLNLVGVTAQPDNDNVNTIEDTNSWKVGGALTFAGFDVAASFVDSGDSRRTKNDGSDSGSAYSAGVKYATGPVSLSLTYIHAKNDNVTGTTGDVFKAVSLNANYVLAPGLDMYGGISWFDVKSPDSTATQGSNATTVTKNDGQQFVLGTKVSF